MSRFENDQPMKGWIYLLFFLSGFTWLVYEMTWMKWLGLTFGNTPYAVSLILAGFMMGLALGSLLLGRWIDTISDKRNSLRIFGLLQIGIGLSALLFPFLLKRVDLLYLFLIHIFNLGPQASLPLFFTQGLRFLLSFLLLLLPTMLMGGTFPVLCRVLVSRIGRMGLGVGLLYGLNTVGAVMGAL
ncbi:spermidine synthase, partial [candidate division TA06 bacterium]|nr:spermidine synthase [candidate division TA06 bacterium]